MLSMLLLLLLTKVKLGAQNVKRTSTYLFPGSLLSRAASQSGRRRHFEVHRASVPPASKGRCPVYVCGCFKAAPACP
jgi:hypothetical protein